MKDVATVARKLVIKGQGCRQGRGGRHTQMAKGAWAVMGLPDVAPCRLLKGSVVLVPALTAEVETSERLRWGQLKHISFSLSENFARDLEMFARWVKSGVVRRRAGVRSAGRPSGAALLESLSSSFFFVFCGGSSLTMIPQEYNICFNHVHSDLIWHFLKFSKFFF